MSTPLRLLSTGMVTAVGLDAAASCAAIRARLDGFQEIRFQTPAGDMQVGGPVPLPRKWIGQRRMAHLAAGALTDAMARLGAPVSDKLAVILCLSEAGRIGAPIRDEDAFSAQLRSFAGLGSKVEFHSITHGRPSGFAALEQARRILSRRQAEQVIILGVDSYLMHPCLSHYAGDKRLLDPDNANGFIPGEAAAVIILEAGAGPGLTLTGLGLAREDASIYNAAELPLRADGMTQAYRDALEQSDLQMHQVGYRISDLIGEAYWFKQSALAHVRLTREPSEQFQDFWSPTESIGNIGAAVVPLMMGMALTASQKGYDIGSSVLIEASGDDGACGAAVFRRAA
ncbi:MAG: 3-oxoacyl-ACP synthase [Pseudomonadota bacterium]